MKWKCKSHSETIKELAFDVSACTWSEVPWQLWSMCKQPTPRQLELDAVIHCIQYTRVLMYSYSDQISHMISWTYHFSHEPSESVLITLMWRDLKRVSFPLKGYSVITKSITTDANTWSTVKFSRILQLDRFPLDQSHPQISLFDAPFVIRRFWLILYLSQNVVPFICAHSREELLTCIVVKFNLRHGDTAYFCVRYGLQRWHCLSRR